MTNEELIAEARKASRAVYLAVPGPVADDLSRIITGLADALEGALPKEVQTVEELDALPVGSVIRGDLGYTHILEIRLGGWYRGGEGYLSAHGVKVELPARVLFTPPLTDLERLSALRSALTHTSTQGEER